MQDKIVFKKFPDPSKKIKNATHNPTQLMIRKPNIDNGLRGRMTEHQLPTKKLARVAEISSIECLSKIKVLTPIEVFGKNTILANS